MHPIQRGQVIQTPWMAVTNGTATTITYNAWDIRRNYVTGQVHVNPTTYNPDKGATPMTAAQIDEQHAAEVAAEEVDETGENYNAEIAKKTAEQEAAEVGAIGSVDFPEGEVPVPETMLVWRRRPKRHNHIGGGVMRGYGEHVRASTAGYCEPCRYAAGLPPLTETDNTQTVPYDEGMRIQNATTETRFRPGDFVRVGARGMFAAVVYVNTTAHEEKDDGDPNSNVKVGILRTNRRQEQVAIEKLTAVEDYGRIPNAIELLREAMRLSQVRYDMIVEQCRKRAVAHWRGGSTICTAGLADWLESCELRPLQQRMTTQVTIEGLRFEVPGCAGNRDKANARMQQALSRAKLVFHEDDADIRVKPAGPIGSITRVEERFEKPIAEISLNELADVFSGARRNDVDRNERSDAEFAHTFKEHYRNGYDRDGVRIWDHRIMARSSTEEEEGRDNAGDGPRNPFHPEPAQAAV